MTGDRDEFMARLEEREADWVTMQWLRDFHESGIPSGYLGAHRVVWEKSRIGHNVKLRSACRLLVFALVVRIPFVGRWLIREFKWNR